MQQALSNSCAYEFSQSGLQNGLMPPIKDDAEPDLSTVGGRLAYVRGLRGLSTTELARRAGYSQPTVWALENNDTKEPAARLVAALAAALDTTWEFLLRGPDSSHGIEQSLAEAEVLSTYRALDEPSRFSMLEFSRHLRGKTTQREADADVLERRTITKPSVRKSSGRRSGKDLKG